MEPLQAHRALRINSAHYRPCRSKNGAHPAPLHRDADRNSDARIPVVVQVITVVLVNHVDVVGVIPVIRPVCRPWVEKCNPIAVVLETRVPIINHEGKAEDPEQIPLPKVDVVPGVRHAVAVVPAPLLPGAVVGLPVPCAMILPGRLLRALLLLSALRLLVLPLRRRLLGVLLWRRLLPLRRLLLGVLLWRWLLPLRRLLLGVLLRSWLLPLCRLRLGVLLRRRLLPLCRLLLGVLLRRWLLPLCRLLLRVLLRLLTLLVALPLILGEGRSSHSKRQCQNGRSDDEFRIHKRFL